MAEALTSALDYRGWHEFVIQRYSDGQWRPATGPASGGEHTLVVSVPLFAPRLAPEPSHVWQLGSAEPFSAIRIFRWPTWRALRNRRP